MQTSLPRRIQSVVDDCLPLLRALSRGRYAVAIGGSFGKGTCDGMSDIDFRLYCDEAVGAPNHGGTPQWRAFQERMDHWRAAGTEIDGCWIRNIGQMERQLDAWLAGDVQPVPMVWTLWGYYLPTDLANLRVVEDPEGIVAAWNERLAAYPEALKRAVVRKHLGSLRYWRDDYHYRNKVARGDAVFLAGLSARLVHDMLQVLFALNETYYVGDGNNLRYAAQFATLPERFCERVERVLYPSAEADPFAAQRQAIVDLIDEVAALADDVAV